MFVDSSGPKTPVVQGSNAHTPMIKDDATRFAWVYFLRRRSDATTSFTRFLADCKEERFLLGKVRSDNGGESKGGDFSALCRDRYVRQEYTPPDSPQFNGVVERAVGHAESVAKASIVYS